MYSRNFLQGITPDLICECKGTNFFYSTKLFFTFFVNFFINTLITNDIFLQLFLLQSTFFAVFFQIFLPFFAFLIAFEHVFVKNTRNYMSFRYLKHF